MFPRGYFGKVGKFIAWILVLAGGIWGLLQVVQVVFRADVNNVNKDALCLCDCHNNAKNMNPSYHAFTCSYYIWAMKQAVNNKSQMGKEDKSNVPVQTRLD